jgi:hypothetical protein
MHREDGTDAPLCDIPSDALHRRTRDPSATRAHTSLADNHALKFPLPRVLTFPLPRILTFPPPHISVLPRPRALASPLLHAPMPPPLLIALPPVVVRTRAPAPQAWHSRPQLHQLA